MRGAVLVLLGGLAMAWSDRGAERLSATVIVPATVQQQFTGGDGSPGEETDERGNRPIYPMSVVPGGVFSVAELRAHLAADPVARQSFEAQAKRLSDPDLIDHLTVRRVPKPVKMYSQLRKGTKLCWTSQPVTVEAGESGFYSDRSDDLVARARCGNVMVMTVPAGEMRVAPPPPQPIGYTPPPSVQVVPETGVRPQPEEAQPQVVVAGERGVSPPVFVPQRVAQIPPMPMIPPPTVIVPPAAAPPPPVVIPPYVPPTTVVPPPQLLKGGGDGIPWWGLLGGGLLGGAAGRASIHVTQKQWQKQKQKQEQKPPDDTEPVPEPGTMLLMTLGLGAAGGYIARKRRKH